MIAWITGLAAEIDATLVADHEKAEQVNFKREAKHQRHHSLRFSWSGRHNTPGFELNGVRVPQFEPGRYARDYARGGGDYGATFIE
jgi:hypothetical protein